MSSKYTHSIDHSVNSFDLTEQLLPSSRHPVDETPVVRPLHGSTETRRVSYGGTQPRSIDWGLVLKDPAKLHFVDQKDNSMHSSIDFTSEFSITRLG